jgi:energy-coupling factor transporter ATP-binding protein EcfA2
MKNKYSAFLSHNSQDKSIVEKIAQWLQDNANLSVWLDKWNLIPGDPWQEEIEKALDESQCCVVFLGPKGMGPWQNMEMRSVLNTRVSENSIRVVPVLLPGAVRQKESKLPRFLRELTWVVFNVKWDESEALHGLVCGIEAKEPGRYKGDIQEDICPFRGLEIFREQDRQFFFGREVLVQRLLDKIERNRFLVVTGPSGCGKSSLVQAGLISSLRQHSQVTLFTPRERPLEELAFALRTCYPEKNKPTVEKLRKRLKEGMDILHLIAREILEYSDKKNLLIIIDQFEELFAQTKSEDERRRFISLILDAVDIPNGPVTVILTIRSDFIGKCAFYKNLNMFVNDHFVQVEPMGIEELRQAIEEPARMVGLRFEDGLANRILADVKGAPGELPLVEHALLELYEGRKGRLLLAQAYDGIGGIAGALVNRAESEFNKLDESEKEILRKMFVLRLIQPGEGTEDTRRRAAKEELLAIGGDVKVVEKILNQWINARLLTSTRDTPRQQVLIDVAHESLIRKWDRTQTWMAEGREAARLTGILRQAALEWKGANRSPDYLFQGARLLQMEGLVNTHADDLTEDEIEFVKAGVKLREAKEIEKEEQRRKELRAAQELAAAKSKVFKRARMITAIIFLFLMSVIFLAYNLNIKEKSTRKQLALNYWDNSHQAREKGQMLYFLHLCAEAMSVHPDQAFNKTLLFDMNDFWEILPLVHIFHYEEPIYGAIFNTDKTRFLTWSNNKTALQWDAKTGKQIGNTMMHRDVVKGALFNVDGRQILTWSMDGTVRLWDAKTGKPIGKALLHQDDVKGALFNPDGTQILTLIADGTGPPLGCPNRKTNRSSFEG